MRPPVPFAHGNPTLSDASFRIGTRSACIMLAALSLGAGPPAGESVEPVRVTYEAPAGCPDEAQFFEQVARRTDRARRANEGEPARIFDVALVREGGRTSARLLITSIDGSVARREVFADDCAEAVSAVALIAALAIDPRASITPDGNEQAAQAAAPTPPVAPAPALATNAPIPPVSQPGRELGAGRPPAPAAPETGTSFRWSIGADAHALGGLVPTVALGGGAHVALAPVVSEGFAPSFRVSFFAVTTESSFQGSIGATVSWFLARAETCPARPRLSSAFVLEICGNVDGGVFRSSGTGLLNPETVSKPWFAFGAGTRLGWRSGDNVELELGLGLTVPVRHYPFTYDDTLGGHNQVNVFEIRPVAAVATAGVGYQFQ